MKALRRGATVLALSIGGILGAGRSVGEETPSPDPLLPFGTFLGGSDSDSAKFLARGPDGALWIVGSSYSLDFPGAPRAAGEENGGDVVVLRFDPVTRTVLSAAWMGSTGYDAPAGIAFDHAGTAYIAGTTGNSATFPVTTGIPNPGDFDSGAFVARVLPDGSGFAWTTVLGGSGWDEATGLAVTPEGDPVVVGRTSSPDFPLKNPFLGVRGGNRDAFVARLRADGTGLVFSSLLGGSDVDDASAAAISPSGGILVAGSTRSPDFPSGEQLLESPSGELGGFLVEIAPDGGSLLRAARLASTDVSGMLVDAEDRLLYELDGDAWQSGNLRQTLDSALTRNVENFPLTHDFPGTGRKTLRLSTRRIEGKGSRPALILLELEE